MVFDFLKRKEPLQRFSSDPEQRSRQRQIEKIFEEKERQKRTKSDVARQKRRILPTSAERFQVRKRVGTFVKTGATLREDFTREQDMLGQMFGGGEKIWGTENEPVKLYSDLNPRQRGDTGTAELFGFG